MELTARFNRAESRIEIDADDITIIVPTSMVNGDGISDEIMIVALTATQHMSAEWRADLAATIMGEIPGELEACREALAALAQYKVTVEWPMPRWVEHDIIAASPEEALAKAREMAATDAGNFWASQQYDTEPCGPETWIVKDRQGSDVLTVTDGATVAELATALDDLLGFFSEDEREIIKADPSLGGVVPVMEAARAVLAKVKP